MFKKLKAVLSILNLIQKLILRLFRIDNRVIALVKTQKKLKSTFCQVNIT